MTFGSVALYTVNQHGPPWILLKPVAASVRYFLVPVFAAFLGRATRLTQARVILANRERPLSISR